MVFMSFLFRILLNTILSLLVLILCSVCLVSYQKTASLQSSTQQQHHLLDVIVLPFENLSKYTPDLDTVFRDKQVWKKLSEVQEELVAASKECNCPGSYYFSEERHLNSSGFKVYLWIDAESKGGHGTNIYSLAILSKEEGLLDCLQVSYSNGSEHDQAYKICSVTENKQIQCEEVKAFHRLDERGNYIRNSWTEEVTFTTYKILSNGVIIKLSKKQMDRNLNERPEHFHSRG